MILKDRSVDPIAGLCPARHKPRGIVARQRRRQSGFHVIPYSLVHSVVFEPFSTRDTMRTSSGRPVRSSLCNSVWLRSAEMDTRSQRGTPTRLYQRVRIESDRTIDQKLMAVDRRLHQLAAACRCHPMGLDTGMAPVGQNYVCAHRREGLLLRSGNDKHAVCR